MPILNIKDPEAHTLASELARRSGHTLTQVVKDALREKLSREELAQTDQQRLVARVLELGRRASSRPLLEPGNPADLLRFDEYGALRS